MKKVVCMSFDKNQWENGHLMKDCGLVPYYFHKIYGYEVIMVGARHGEYPYLDTYVKGLKMEFVEEDTQDARLIYLSKNAHTIDLLILEGAYPINLAFAKLYKNLNTNGKIYLQLDMNSKYAEYVFAEYPKLIEFGDYCDVIAASSTLSQKQMNRKLPWVVERMINGYYDELWHDEINHYEEKKNIILTVARLGSWPKATDVLLDAFAKAMKKIPDWELHLVGGFEEGFEEKVPEYYEKYPDFYGKVYFDGPIYEKEILIQKYKEAKVFTLPSRVEGGPNVVAEALRSGCVMAVTKIDAYKDAIDDGKCGLACEIDDIDGLANVFIKLCSEMDLESMSQAAFENALKNYDYRKSVRALHYMLFGGKDEL